MPRRGFRDRDFLRTTEGLFFCIVGPYHPNDRAISYLKYAPDNTGLWQRRSARYRRIMDKYTVPSFIRTFNFLQESYPKYVFFSSAYGISITAVPRKYVRDHFKPEEKLQKLLQNAHLDSLQNRALDLISLLSELSNVPTTSFGVTGSILLDLHNPAFSDIDIMVYGTDESFRVKNLMSDPKSPLNSRIQRFKGEKLRQWCASKSQNHPISIAEAKLLHQRKWNIGTFRKTPFSVHPAKTERELTEKYGDKKYRGKCMITIQATVTESLESIFLPAVYKVEEVQIDGGICAEIMEVVSYESLYDSLADPGEMIQAYGKLEHVTDSGANKEYDRVLVGSIEGRGKEYIKPLS